MRAVMNNSWTQAARCAALAALLCVPQTSSGQDDPLGPPGADSFGSMFFDKQADPVFEQYGSVKRLASAWKVMDSALMTDAALQFAEGERVLLRSHKLITAAQAFDLAIRMATENKDKDSLARLAKALERTGDKDRLGQVNLALKTAGAARAVDPLLSQGSLEVRLAIEAVQVEIQSARVASSKPHLEAIEKSLADLPINDKQRAALKKAVSDARESISDDNKTAATVQLLDDIGQVERASKTVNRPEGQEFVPHGYSKEPLTEDQIAQIMQLKIKSPPISDTELQPAASSLLDAPSRSGYFATSNSYSSGASYKEPPGIMKDNRPGPSRIYGSNKLGIWQYTNDENKWGTSCGQAAVATMLSYHSPVNYPPITGSTYTRNLVAGFPPDVAFGIFGTGWEQMQKMSKANGLNYKWVNASTIPNYVKNGYPVIVGLDIAENQAGWKGYSYGGHWVAVYAVDSKGYYLTNWPEASKTVCGWPVQSTFFNSGNNSWLIKKLGVAGLGFVVGVGNLPNY